MPTSIRRRTASIVGSFTLLSLLVACSDDSKDVERTEATRGSDADGISSLESEAKAAAVEFFEAQATLDYDAALGRSSGAAAIGVEWAQEVNGIDEVVGTPFEVKAAPSPKTTVVIDRVSEAADDRFTATGYLEIDQRPMLLAPGPIPPDIAPLPTWFVTDLVFTEQDGRLLVDDYRMDDSPYPVSQLVAEFRPPTAQVVSEDDGSSDDGAGDLASSIRVERGHRDIDGTVQYAISFGDTDLDLAAAAFIEGDVANVLPEATGAAMRLLRDRELGAPNASTTVDTGGDDSRNRALGVVENAMPGASGVVRLTFQGPDPDRTVVIDAPVTDWPPLTENPTNEVRRAVAPPTTTSTTSTTTTTVAPSTSIVVVPVPGEIPQAPETTTTSTTTTSTTTTAPASG